MSKTDDKYIVIKREHLKSPVPKRIANNFYSAYNEIAQYLPNHNYVVMDENEPHAKAIKKLIEESEKGRKAMLILEDISALLYENRQNIFQFHQKASQTIIEKSIKRNIDNVIEMLGDEF